MPGPPQHSVLLLDVWFYNPVLKLSQAALREISVSSLGCLVKGAAKQCTPAALTTFVEKLLKLMKILVPHQDFS